MKAIPIDVATKEVEGWLDYKKVTEKKREAYKEQVEVLVEAVAEGSLVVKEDKSLVQTLKFPAEGEAPIKTLEFKPRLRMQQIHQHMQGVKGTDADGRLVAYIAALTSKPKAIILSLDTEDYSVGQSIAIFFL